jgi:hypothetical protein
MPASIYAKKIGFSLKRCPDTNLSSEIVPGGSSSWGWAFTAITTKDTKVHEGKQLGIRAEMGHNHGGSGGG